MIIYWLSYILILNNFQFMLYPYVKETYLTEAREGKLFVHVLVDIIDLQGKFWQIDVEIAQCMCYRPTRG